MASRLLALLISLSACVGIGLEFSTLIHGGATFIDAVWALAAYFTILTNALVSVVFAMAAIRGNAFDRPRLLAWIVSAIVLVGVIFMLLLQGVRTLAGATETANFLLHKLNPVLAMAFWLLFTRKGALHWRDPLLWALYPVSYLAYALIRGGATGRYPYPFIDVSAIGWGSVITNAIVIALCFIAAGEALAWLDHWLARRRERSASTG